MRLERGHTCSVQKSEGEEKLYPCMSAPSESRYEGSYFLNWCLKINDYSVLLGTNLQALIEQAKHPCSSAEIVVVISNKPGVQGLKRASLAGIQTRVTTRSSFSHNLGGEKKCIYDNTHFFQNTLIPKEISGFWRFKKSG